MPAARHDDDDDDELWYYLPITRRVKGVHTFSKGISPSKVGDFSQGRPKGSFFNSYYTEV